MARLAAWLLPEVADGTQRHRRQRSVCAPPKILGPSGRLYLHLPLQISAHVGEEAAVFGGGMHFCSEQRQGFFCLLLNCSKLVGDTI